MNFSYVVQPVESVQQPGIEFFCTGSTVLTTGPPGSPIISFLIYSVDLCENILNP